MTAPNNRKRMLLDLDDDWNAPAYEGATSLRRFKDSIHDYRAYITLAFDTGQRAVPDASYAFSCL